MSPRVVLAQGSFAAVVMARPVADAFYEAPQKGRSDVLRAMCAYADRGPTGLTSVRFRNEGRFPFGDTGGEVLVQAFKGWALRVYGGLIDGRFICVDVRTKKCDWTDRKLLRRVARDLAEASSIA